VEGERSICCTNITLCHQGDLYKMLISIGESFSVTRHQDALPQNAFSVLAMKCGEQPLHNAEENEGHEGEPIPREKREKEAQPKKEEDSTKAGTQEEQQ